MWHCSNICPPMHSILILSLFISHSLQCVFSFLCTISLINRARHDRGLFYKERLPLSNLFLHRQELILMVDMVNVVCSILEALTFLETFQVRAQKQCFRSETWGQFSISVRPHANICSTCFRIGLDVSGLFIGICFYAPFEIKRNICPGSLLSLSVFITRRGAHSNAPQLSI